MFSAIKPRHDDNYIKPRLATKEHFYLSAPENLKRDHIAQLIHYNYSILQLYPDFLGSLD